MFSRYILLTSNVEGSSWGADMLETKGLTKRIQIQQTHQANVDCWRETSKYRTSYITSVLRVVFTVRSSHKSSKHQRFRNLYRIGVLVIWLDCFFDVFSTSMIRPHWDNTEHHYEQAIDFHSWWEDQKLLVCDQNVEIQRLNYLHFILFDYRNLFWNTVQKNMWKIWPRWRTLYRHTQLRVHEAKVFQQKMIQL